MHPIVAQELELLRQALQVLDEEPAGSGPSEASIVRELESLREQIQSGTETKDQGALVQQWNQHSALLQQIRNSRQTAVVDRSSPYFAHLRLREGRNEWDVCLGKATLIKRGVTIVDWRNAPISRLFYRYAQGEEYEEEISGRLRLGEVVARRTVTIRDTRLERIDAPDGIFRADANREDGWSKVDRELPRLAGGEGAAVRAYADGEGGHRRLGTDTEGSRRRADKHLPDIAGLIDPEQFALITRPSAGMVVIRGTAGSGKTTVALHRIAYLAYEDRTVDSDRTLFIVFSRALRNYVSHVLPALGVKRVQVKTLQEWASDLCRRLFPHMPREKRETTPAVVHRLKNSPAMLLALEEHVRSTPGKSNARQVMEDWASVLTNPSLLADAFARRPAGALSAAELERAVEWNRQRYDELLAWMRGEPESDAQIDPEDELILLRAWQLRVGNIPAGGDRSLRYRHIALDEVQDFSPLEVRVLVDCLDEHRSITLAGDTQQHVMQDAGFTSWNEFFDHLGLEGTTVDTLRISYRSTHEIAEFGQNVLGDLREDDTPPLTTRSGPPVEFFRFTDHGACVAFLGDALKALLAAEPFASVAVLSPSRAISEIYYRGLANSEVPRLRLVENQDFTFAPGVEVTEIEQVKGLEFDYVVLVETSASNFPDQPAARRLLHVGVTRAVHQLWLTSVATPSRLLSAAL